MSLIKLSDKVQEAYAIIASANPKGGVTARDIVKYATPTDSPLHDSFTWNDKEAGDRYRLWQARQLLSSVTIEVDSKGGMANFYESVMVDKDDKRERRYFDIDTIIKTPRLRRMVKQQILRDVKSMLIKYSAEKLIYRLINEPEVKKLDAQVKRLMK